ncbi:MAG: hypothetical protein WBM29_12780 [Candidatus Deferrimicrobium sp.]
MQQRNAGGKQIPVYDPRGVVEVESRPVAPRVGDLNGLRLGVLDNTKWNANKLLRRIRDLLLQRFAFAEINYYRKESFSRFADDELIRRIAAGSDVALTAIGD